MDMEHDTDSGFKRAWRRVLAVAILASGIGIGASWGAYDMQKQAIVHGAAGYDTQTGSWDWKGSTDMQVEASSRVSKELFDGQIIEQARIDKKCKALGSKKSKDPSCTLVGE